MGVIQSSDRQGRVWAAIFLVLAIYQVVVAWWARSDPWIAAVDLAIVFLWFFWAWWSLVRGARRRIIRKAQTLEKIKANRRWN